MSTIATIAAACDYIRDCNHNLCFGKSNLEMCIDMNQTRFQVSTITLIEKGLNNVMHSD
jgi:hypothetical protein